MATLNISLPDSLKIFAKNQAIVTLAIMYALLSEKTKKKKKLNSK